MTARVPGGVPGLMKEEEVEEVEEGGGVPGLLKEEEGVVVEVLFAALTMLLTELVVWVLLLLVAVVVWLGFLLLASARCADAPEGGGVGSCLPDLASACGAG